MQRIQDFRTKIKKAKEGSANYELLQQQNMKRLSWLLLIQPNTGIGKLRMF